MNNTLLAIDAPSITPPIRDAVQLPLPQLLNPDECAHALAVKTDFERERLQDGYGDDDDWDWNESDRRQYVKPSQFDTSSSTPNRLREELGALLGYHAVRNVKYKLFRGVRPADELPGQETQRTFHKVRSAHNLKKTVVGQHFFYSRKDFTVYCNAIMASYEDFELLDGANEQFMREVLHHGGYVDRAAHGFVFLAPFKKKHSERVLCFITPDGTVTAEFPDVVVRRVPGSTLKAAEVPLQAYVSPLEQAVMAQQQQLQKLAYEQAYAAYRLEQDSRPKAAPVEVTPHWVDGEELPF